MKTQTEYGFEICRKYIHQFTALSEPDWASLSSLFSVERYPRKSVLVEEGKTADRLFFLYNGYVRFSISRENGTEVTTDFFFAPGFITSFTSFVEQVPSRINILAMGDIETLTLSHSSLERLYSGSPEINYLGRKLTEKVFIETEKHLISLLSDSPAQRYLRLMNEQPGYIHHIPLRILASYLGITPESLSRIRKRILK